MKVEANCQMRVVRIGNYYYYSRWGDATGHVSSSSSDEECTRPFNPLRFYLCDTNEERGFNHLGKEWNGFCNYLI